MATPRKKPEDLLPKGRPTDYRPELCDDLIEFCSQGYSVTAWCGKNRYARSSVNAWASKHPAFSEALWRAKAACLHFFEKQNVDIAVEGGSSSRATVVIFGMKNMGGDEWQERSTRELTGKDGAPIAVEAQTSPERMKAALALLLASQGGSETKSNG